jgi:hypothetical protein
MTGPFPISAGRPRVRLSPSRLGSRPARLLALLAALVLALSACGGAASLEDAGNPIDGQSVEAPVPAAGGITAEKDATFERTAADEAAAAIGGPLVVRTGQLDLEVADLEEALASAEAAVAAAGGYIAASERTGDAERASAMVTYRIPAERWESTLAALRAVGDTVLAERTSSEEVTSQVVDLGARLANLRATEAALQAIMTRATKIPDVLEVQAQLSTVRQEIEQLTAQKVSLEARAALATLTVGFALPPVVAVTQVREGWDPAAEIDRAAATLVGLGQGLLNAAIWVAIVVAPLVLLIGIVVAVAWLLARRLRPRAAAGPAPTDLPVA